MKYKYTGSDPVILIDFHKEVNPNDVIEVGAPIDNVFFVPVDDKKSAKEATNN